jgi:hypothetical protein
MTRPRLFHDHARHFHTEKRLAGTLGWRPRLTDAGPASAPAGATESEERPLTNSGSSQQRRSAGLQWGRPELQEKMRAVNCVVGRLCRQLDLPMPALTYDANSEINAGVTGSGPHDAVLFFSRGALAKLTGVEAAAVAAHELAHIAAGDFDDRRFVPCNTGIAPLRWVADWLVLLSWTMSKRRKEYAADRLAAALVGEDPLISALRKTAHDTHSAVRPWFAAHPHPRRRIRALRKLRRARHARHAGNKLAIRALS